MTSEHDIQDGFVPLWPTILMQRRLPDHGEQDGALIKLVRGMERANKELTTEYLDSDFFTLDRVLKWSDGYLPSQS
ncbi:MAG: hypothetical protein ACTSXZ_10905 [Alphaproteobacteria bacterium]